MENIKKYNEYVSEYHQSNIDDVYIEETNEEILDGIRDAVEEVNLHLEGKKKLRPARELLNEL